MECILQETYWWTNKVSLSSFLSFPIVFGFASMDSFSIASKQPTSCIHNKEVNINSERNKSIITCNFSSFYTLCIVLWNHLTPFKAIIIMELFEPVRINPCQNVYNVVTRKRFLSYFSCFHRYVYYVTKLWFTFHTWYHHSDLMCGSLSITSWKLGSPNLWVISWP